jgi:hypothetical protein
LIESATGIQSRGELECDVARVDASPFQMGKLPKGPDPVPFPSREFLEPVSDENPVLVEKRNHIGNRSEGNKVEVPFEVRWLSAMPKSLFAKSRPESDQKLEGDPHTRQLVKGETTVILLRIENSHCRREVMRNLMMVDHNGIDSNSVGLLNLTAIRHTAIGGDDQVDSICAELSESVHVKPIALSHSVRDIVVGFHPQFAEKGHKNGGCSDTIHIVVPVYENLLPVAQGFLHPVNGTVHVFHEKRRVEVREGRSQKTLGLFRGSHATVEKDQSGQG